jgi:hypothetical protein
VKSGKLSKVFDIDSPPPPLSVSSIHFNTEDINEEMNMMEGDYEKSLGFNSYFNEDDNYNQNDTFSSQYRAFSDALQA